LLYRNEQHVLTAITLGALFVSGVLCFSLTPASAEEKAPPALSAAAVREMVSSTAPVTPKTDAANDTAPGTATPIRTSVPNAKNTSTADGIPVDGVEPLSKMASDQLELERQAEEAASKAAAEDARQEQEHNHKSYDRAAEGLMPLSTEQIRAFMRKLEQTQEAAQPPAAGEPKGEVKVTSLSLDPGVAPPQVNLAAGYVTTIAIVDQTGRPWPILDVGVGGNFEVTPTAAGSHVVRVVPLTRFGSGNLSIMLKDLPTPVIFRLSAGGSTFHMRFDARVPGLGPQARTPLIQRQSSGLVAGDQTISMILEDAPPKEAKRLKIGGTDSRTKVWKIGSKVYVRTPLSLLSPAWNASASSADGMTVYEVGEAPVLLLSDNGAMIRARIAQDEDHD